MSKISAEEKYLLYDVATCEYENYSTEQECLDRVKEIVEENNSGFETFIIYRAVKLVSPKVDNVVYTTTSLEKE